MTVLKKPITDLPPNPSRGDSSDEFVAKADAHVAAQGQWTREVNQLGMVFNLTAETATLGYLLPVNYDAGLLMTIATQCVQHDGVTYAPKLDALPFTTNGVFEAEKFRVIQGITSAELGVHDGASRIGTIGAGGVPETVAETLGNIQHVRRADISTLLTIDGPKVIGGDSTSFSAYGFGDGLDPGGNAYDNPPGLMSWAHMLRDACYASDPFFISTEKLVVKGANGFFNSSSQYTFPFNNRYKQFLATNAQRVQITLRDRVPSNIYGTAVLLFAKNPADNRCGNVDIYVDGVFNQTINLDGKNGPFRGHDMVRAVVPSGVITLQNFKNPDGTPAAAAVGAFILGVTHHNPSIHLTGHGGWTAKNTLDDYGMRIGRYAPDVLFLALGANDMLSADPAQQRTPEQFYNDLVSIVSMTRELKPNSEIVFISPPPSSSFNAETKTSIVGWAGLPVFAWLKKIQQVAREYGCFYLDLYDVLGHIPRSIWRFDNIHFTKVGNNIVYRALKDLVFPSMPEPRDVFIDALFNNGTSGLPYALPNFDGVLCHHDGMKWVVDSDASGIVESITQPREFDYEVQVLYSNSHYLVGFEHFGPSDRWFGARPYTASYYNSRQGLDAFYIADMRSVPVAELASKEVLAGAQFFLRFALRSR